LDLTLTVTGLPRAAAGHAVLHTVAAVLRDHGVAHALVDLDDLDPHFTLAKPAVPLVFTAAVRYSGTLETALTTAVTALDPALTSSVEWNPVDGTGAEDQERTVAAFRFARLVDGSGAVAAGLGRALGDGGWGPDLRPPFMKLKSVLLQALYDELRLTAIDWKAAPDEAAAALGAIRGLPTGLHTVAEMVGDYSQIEALAERWDEPDERMAYEVVADAVGAHLAAGPAGPAVLLQLENGDTPCFMVAAPDLVHELIEAGRPAGLEISRHG
jgi:hypothetical protein